MAIMAKKRKINNTEPTINEENNVQNEISDFVAQHKDWLEDLRIKWDNSKHYINWFVFQEQIKERFRDKKIKSIVKVGLTYEFQNFLITVKFNKKSFVASYKAKEVVYQKEKVNIPSSKAKPGVYHVANPDVRGDVVGKNSIAGTCDVVFDEKVSFSGNPYREPSKNWTCNPRLLFSSPEEARKNHNPNHD